MLLYLHIPFCHRICPYCSFYKHTPGPTQTGAFIKALTREANHRMAASHAAPRTIYLGGGTPSMLSPSHLTQLFASLRENIDFSKLEEITLEANPATFDAKKATLFRELGITRVSLGIQSFTSHVLQTLGREHSPDDAARSVGILHRAGIPKINIDLMFSIPGQSKDDWATTITQAISLKPHHISAYNLTYEEDTTFFESLQRGEMLENEDIDAEYFHLAHELLTNAGFEHYETSNYAQPGHQSSHNLGYWQGEDYLGLGPSAVTTIGNTRSKNIADTSRYIEQVNTLGHALGEAEHIAPESRRIERIALGLRTSMGIPMSLLDPAAQTRANTLASEGIAHIANQTLTLIGRGRALVDPIAAELI